MTLPVPPAELAAIASLWKTSRRELSTSFLGTSMLPTIAPGQPVTIRCGDSFTPGDVVLLVLGSTILVHRLELVSRDGERVLTRGDHHVLPDFPARVEDVLGVVGGAPPAPGGVFRALILRVCAPVFQRDQEICHDLIRTLRLFSIPGLFARITQRFRALRQAAS